LAEYRRNVEANEIRLQRQAEYLQQQRRMAQYRFQRKLSGTPPRATRSFPPGEI
jgi:hypothetical protein